MKTSITIIFFIICCNFCFSQEKGSSVTKSYYKSGQAISYGVDYHYDRISYYNEEGDIVSERKYVDQKGNQIISFFNKGRLQSKYIYKNDKRNGEALGYYDSGTIKWKGSYENDLQIGEWYGYYENGRKYSFRIFENGKPKVDSIFNAVEKISMVVEYHYYKNQLEKRIYYENGLYKSQEVFFKDQELECLTTSFYKNGNVKYTGGFRKGKMFGERFYYNETGELCNGKFTAYNDSGFVERDGRCINGKPEGEFIVYDSNREIVIKASFKNGKSEGPSYFYNPGDTTVRIEQYKNGKFIKEVKESLK